MPTLFPYDKIQEAIDFLKENEPPEGYDVKFSGGKDSIVLYDIVKKSGVQHTVHYNFTTIDPPELTRFILKKYPEVKWIRPKQTFFRYLLKFGLPTKDRRWCCAKLKHRVGAKGVSKHKAVGIRAEESFKRAKRGKIISGKWQSDIAYAPIVHFTEGDVWDYIEKHNLSYPSLYDEGFSRLGCVICPFICRSGILEQHKARWRKIYSKFEAVTEKLYEHKKEYYQSQGLKSAQELLACWYSSKSVVKKDEEQLFLW